MAEMKNSSLAQLGLERYIDSVGVISSNLIGTTIRIKFNNYKNRSYGKCN